VSNEVPSIYKAFETSPKAEADEGICLDYGPVGKIWIARAGGANQKFINYYNAQMKPYTRQIQNNTLDNEVARNLEADIFARTILLRWEEIRGRDGQLLEFTVDNAKQLLLDLPVLMQDIRVAAQDASLFRKSVIEDVVGN